MSKKIVLASNNKKKMKEMQELLAPMGAEVISQGSLGIPSAEEPFGTFVENALTKARWAAKHSGLPAIADDSGICADALKGAPGVLSARFAGEPSSDAANNAKLIKELVDKDNRNAHYTCVIVAVRDENDPEPLIAIDFWNGTIGYEPKGEGGFGYDPFFIVTPDGKTAAQMTAEEKNLLRNKLSTLVSKI